MTGRPVEEWADLKYQPDHLYSHIVPFGQHFGLCGAQPLGLDGWYGTGDWSEIEHARSLALCAECAARVPSSRDQVMTP